MKHKKLMSAVLASAMLLTGVPSSILPVSAKDTDSGIQITTESTNNSDIQFDSSDDGISVDNSDSESDIVVSNTENAKVSQSGDTQDITISDISGQSEDDLKATVENTTKKSLNVGDKAKLHVTAENASAEESVLRLYFCKVDGALSSNKDDWGTYLSQPSLDLKVDGLNDKCELSVDVKDKDGNTSKSTVSFLKTVENDKVTSRYATLKLPAGAKTEFDLNVTSANQTTATIIPVMEQKGFRYKDAVSVKWEEALTFLGKVGNFFTGKKTTSAVSTDDIKIEDVQGEEIKLETSSSVEQTLGASVTAEKAEVKTGKTSKLSVKAKNTSEKDATFKLYFSEVEGDLSSDKGVWLSYLRQPATNVSVDGFDKNDTKKVKITVDGKETEATLRIMKVVEDGKIVSRYMVMDLPAKATAEFDVSVLSNGAEKVTFIPVIKQDGTNFGDAATVSWTGSKKKAVSVFDTDEIQGKELEKDLEKDLETERQMKQLLKEIGVGFAESDAQANISSMPRRAKAARAAGDVINTGRIQSNSLGRIDVINYNDPSWPKVLTWNEGLLGNTDTKEPLFCADPMDKFQAGKKTGVDASTIYNKETIQTVAAMMYYYDHYMCKSINSDYEYLMKQCAVWWVLNAAHGWFADGVQIETGNGVKCACGGWMSGHKADYYRDGLVWAWENYKYFADAKGVIYQGNGQPLSSWSGTYNPKTYTGLTVQKVWTDQQNAHGLRPSRVKINLIRWSNKDATRRVIDSAYINPSDNKWNWKVTWNNLIRTDGDITYEYTAEEEAVPNYVGSMKWSGSYEAGYTGVLTNEIKTYTSLAVKKEWDDQNDYFKVRPDSITVDLYWWSNKDSTRKLWKTATLSDANNWSVTWDNLPYAEGDTTYEYTAVERGPVDGYTGKLKWTGSYEEGWLGTITNTVQTGWLKLHKSSSLPDMTDGNGCYDLTGAKYTVYTDEACTKEAIVGGELVTDKNGDTKAVELLPGDYWVKETQGVSNNSYKVNETVFHVEVTTDNTSSAPCLLKVEEEPWNDPLVVSMTKKWDGEETPTIPTLAGTQFTVLYYDGYYDTKAQLPSPTKKWIIELQYDDVSNTYFAMLGEDWLVDGSDTLYKNELGNTVLPLGTYAVYESKSAPGYTLDGTMHFKGATTAVKPTEWLIQQVKSNEDGIMITGNNEYESENTPVANSIVVKKFKPDGKTPLANVTFELKNSKGEVVTTMTTGSDGVIKFTDLYPDRYTITEIKTPDGNTKLAEPIVVDCPMRVTDDDINRLGIDRTKVTYDPVDKIYYIFDQTYNVTNDANFAIPHTGAMITAKRFIPIVCGMVVLMGAMCIVFFKKKRRH